MKKSVFIQNLSTIHSDAACFLDVKSMFLEITYTCENEDGTAFTQEDMICHNNPGAHCLIDSVDINIGECALSKSDKG